jgi:hypothetical protein
MQSRGQGGRAAPLAPELAALHTTFQGEVSALVLLSPGRVPAHFLKPAAKFRQRRFSRGGVHGQISGRTAQRPASACGTHIMGHVER